VVFFLSVLIFVISFTLQFTSVDYLVQWILAGFHKFYPVTIVQKAISMWRWTIPL